VEESRNDAAITAARDEHGVLFMITGDGKL
jgi:hypothetical protein